MSIINRLFWPTLLILSISLFAEERSLQEQSSKEPSSNSSCSKELEYAQPPCSYVKVDKPPPTYDQGFAICPDDLPKGYLAPARIDICGSKDAYAVASFIYWEPLANQLDLGTANLNSVDQFKLVKTKSSSDFKPGFKIGFGRYFSYDDWELYGQYTFLHMNKKTSFDPSSFFWRILYFLVFSKF